MGGGCGVVCGVYIQVTHTSLHVILPIMHESHVQECYTCNYIIVCVCVLLMPFSSSLSDEEGDTNVCDSDTIEPTT